MKLEDFFVMISLRILVMGYLKNILPLPFKNSEKCVKTQVQKVSCFIARLVDLIHLKLYAPKFVHDREKRR